MVYKGDIKPILKALEHIRIDYDININDIAYRTNKSPQTVSNFFKGRQPNTTLDTLKMYCDAMDCDLIIDIVRCNKSKEK